MSLRIGYRFLCSHCAYDCETEDEILTHVKKTEHISLYDYDRKIFDPQACLIQLKSDSNFVICPICVTRVLEHEKELHTEKYHLN